VLIAISSSGNSPNIVRALEVANALEMNTISLTGFTGGKAAKISKLNLHVPIHNYGIVEDCHQILMHIIAQAIRTIHTNVDLNSVRM
jgi:phosphoheptose isomerase